MKTPVAAVTAICKLLLLNKKIHWQTENILEHAKEKWLRKQVDLTVVNDVSQIDIGFEGDENAVTILSGRSPIVLTKAPKQKITVQLINLINSF